MLTGCLFRQALLRDFTPAWFHLLFHLWTILMPANLMILNSAPYGHTPSTPLECQLDSGVSFSLHRGKVLQWVHSRDPTQDGLCNKWHKEAEIYADNSLRQLWQQAYYRTYWAVDDIQWSYNLELDYPFFPDWLGYHWHIFHRTCHSLQVCFGDTICLCSFCMIRRLTTNYKSCSLLPRAMCH